MAVKDIIKIKEVTFKYKEKEILKKLSLNIREGEFIGITGKNGSGKSTLVKLISGLNFPDSGSIYFKDTVISKKTIEDIRTMLSIVFQNPNNQIVGSKVIDDLAFGLENIGVHRAQMVTKIYEIAKKLKIEHLLQKSPNELSGGEKQVVAIAGILLLDPKVIIFDEVTSMLDIESSELVFNLILELKKIHTIIMISHDSSELSKVDRVVLLDEGRVVDDLTPRELFLDDKLLDEYRLEKPFCYMIEQTMSSRSRGKDND